MLRLILNSIEVLLVTGNLEEVFDSRLNINTSLRRSSSSLYTVGFEYFKPFEFNRQSNGFLFQKRNMAKVKGMNLTIQILYI